MRPICPAGAGVVGGGSCEFCVPGVEGGPMLPDTGVPLDD